MNIIFSLLFSLLFSLVIGVFIIVIIANYFSHKIFTNLPHSTRSEFLKCAFEIIPQDCERMRFNGLNFFHSSETPYTSYNSIHISESILKPVSNPNIPHVASWKYQRVDGGPDLRYRQNIKVMLSQRHTIHFEGKKQYMLYAYTHPRYSDIKETIRKFNTFLCGVQENDYETEFSAFKVVHEAIELNQNQLNELQIGISSCEDVIVANNKIQSTHALSNELQEKVQEAQTRKLEFIEKINDIKIKLKELSLQKNTVIQSVKKRCDVAQNCKTISLFASTS